MPEPHASCPAAILTIDKLHVGHRGRRMVYSREWVPIFNCSCVPSVFIAGSLCAMRRNTHTMVPKENFRLLSPEENQTLYQVQRDMKPGLACIIRGAHQLGTSSQMIMLIVVCPPHHLAVQHMRGAAPLLQEVWDMQVCAGVVTFCMACCMHGTCSGWCSLTKVICLPAHGSYPLLVVFISRGPIRTVGL